MDQRILEICKGYIEYDQFTELKEYVQYLIENQPMDYRLPWEYLYQQVYLHACLKKKPEMAQWLTDLFPSVFDEVQQIALRQMFAYGRYLLNK